MTLSESHESHDLVSGWLNEDFIDGAPQRSLEDTPWDIPQNESGSDISVSNNQAGYTSTNGVFVEESEYVRTGYEPSDSDEAETEDLPDEDEDINTWLELEVVTEWEKQDGAPPAPRDFQIDEPLNVVQGYDDQSRQKPFLPDEEDVDLTRQVRIVEFIASIEDVTQFQEERIVEILQGYSDGRLRNWLAWLSGKKWTGKPLQLYLEFWEFWRANSDLWQILRWRSIEKRWANTLYSYSLSRECAYELLCHRSDCSAEDIIDPDWLADWDEIDTWIRVREGFFSFADFAAYRSRLHYAEDWMYRPDLGVDLYSPNDYREIPIVSLSFPSVGPSIVSWFSSQEWYDHSEWHDGLGWHDPLIDIGKGASWKAQRPQSR